MKQAHKKWFHFHKKQLLIGSFVTVGLLVGLLVSVFIYNSSQEGRNQNVEVSFVTPRQAVIFWATEDKTVGYVRYGTTEKNRDTTVYQTSSQPGTVHAVVLEDLPLEGVSVSLHNESDSWFLFDQLISVKFNPDTFIE